MVPIKEYADRAIQTDADTARSPYSDPAVVLIAPAVNSHILAQEPHTGHHHSISASSPNHSDCGHAVTQSPISPMFAPLVSRRLAKRKHARYLAGEIVGRRIVSMPENKRESPSNVSPSRGKRAVSMPDHVRPILEPSVELLYSPSTAAGDSFGSHSGRRERVRVFRTPSEGPQTPSPPSSPESLLIIAAGTQLPEGFLRRKYSSEPLVEEDEDWITWANSPPRPIPALHGPLSLPYARCPSGAEGTIIEESDNVAQMIWGLGLDDQPQNQIRIEHTDGSQNASSCGSIQAPPPRPQKKRTFTTQQVPKSSRAQSSAHTNHAKPGNPRTQRQARDTRPSPTRVSPDIETRHNGLGDVPWNEVRSMPTSVEASDALVNDADVITIDGNHVLEWQIARLRQALRSSLVDIDAYGAFPGRLEPVIPAGVGPGFPPSYPRIFVEPRPNESVNPGRQSAIEVAQQYRHHQLYRQALQKQKLQAQNLLPTPPDSSSPQWSSQFSPYLPYYSTLSPELIGSTEYPNFAPSPKYRTGNASQFSRHVYDRHEHDNINSFDTTIRIPPAKAPQIAQNVNSAAPLGQCPSTSATLARYIKQLQALSPIAHFSPLQPVPPPNAPLPPLPSTDKGGADSLLHSPMVPTPPSPESPQNFSREHNGRSIPSTRRMERRLSSVPEEDSALLEFSTFASPSSLQSQVKTTRVPSSQDGTTGHQMRCLEVPFCDMTRKPVIPDFESNPPTAFNQETSPVKVRLPVTKESNGCERVGGYHEQNKEGHQHGHRKKHRYKKLKAPAITPEQAPTRGLVG